MHGGRRMPKYAVKIGEVLLTSDKPISTEQRTAAMKMLRKEEPMPLELQGDLEVKLAIDRH